MNSSTNCFHIKTIILADFQICIGVPLNFEAALKVTVLNSNTWRECQLLSLQNFGSSGCYCCQLRQFTGSVALSRFKVTLVATLSNPIIDGKHSVFQVFGSSERYKNVNSQSCWDFGSSESYGKQECHLPLLTGFW